MHLRYALVYHLMYCMHFHSLGAAKKLVQELGSRFPAHQLMEALGMVYPQYWCVEDCRTNFERHIQVVKLVRKKCRKGTGSATGLEAGELDIGSAATPLVIQVRM
jgi:hypothetical protein